MLSLLFFLFFKINSIFFDTDNPIQIIPDPEGINKNSLFGHDVKYSKYSKMFIVGAPRAIDSQYTPAEIGATYMCPINDRNPCKERIRPNINYDARKSLEFKTLFGFSFIECDKDIILICGPNIAFSNVDFYCAKYNSSSKFILSGTSFPLKRLNENESVIYDNYGIQVESWSEEITPESIFIYSQTNSVYNTILAPVGPNINSIIFGSPSTSLMAFPLRYLPGNKFLVNYHDTENYLFVPYPDTNFLLGSFGVFSQSYINRQSIDILLGTPGQQFGYSGAIGYYNNDDCDDVIFTAPFYSEKPDQGLIYIYFCDKVSKYYLSTPQILKGENIPYARFGVSVVNIQDRNNDHIDDIAVLASFWYTDSPVVYIYLSTSDGLPQHYVEKIELIKSGNSLENIAYKLIANFDVDNDTINEFAVTYPIQNRFEYYIGLKYLDIKGYIRYKEIENNEIISDTFIKIELKMIKIPIKVYFDITNLNDADLEQKPILKYKISTFGRENSYIDIVGYPTFTDGSIYITQVNKMIEIETTILYWLYPIVDDTHIKVLAEGFVEKNPNCNNKCLKTAKISFTDKFIPRLISCNELSCLPKLSLQVKSFDQQLDIGNSNIREIEINIKKRDDIEPIFPQIIFICPNFVNVVSYELVDQNNIEIIKNQQTNSNRTSNYKFTWKYDFKAKNLLTFKLILELIPNIGEENLDLIFAVQDAMFGKQTEDSKLIKLTLGKNPIILNGISIPKVINISKYDDKNLVGGIDKVVYQLQIYNSQQYLPLKDVYIYIRIPILYKNEKIFDFLEPKFDIPIKQIQCKNDLFTYCGDNVFTFYNPIIDPNSIIKISITLRENNKTIKLSENNVKKIELYLILQHKTDNNSFSYGHEVTTMVKSLTLQITKDFIIAISVAVIVSLLVIGILIFIVIKLKLADKLKERFSRKLDTKI